MRSQWIALGGAALAAVLGAACGEEVVVQGALSLARNSLVSDGA